MSRKYPFSEVRLIDQDLSINLGEANRMGDHMLLVATEPLTHGEPWVRFACNELKVLAEGAAVWSSAGAKGIAVATHDQATLDETITA